MTATLTDTTLTDVLQESFTLSVTDGAWYPVEAPEYRALVRVHVHESGYCVERRRSLGSAWAPIAVVAIAEFDPGAFRAWRRAWRLVAA